jgi:hypothetical protein
MYIIYFSVDIVYIYVVETYVDPIRDDRETAVPQIHSQRSRLNALRERSERIANLKIFLFSQ